MAVLAGVILIVLTGVIANIALPVFSSVFSTSAHNAVWIVNAYQISLLLSYCPASLLAEKLGSRNLFLSGLALFAASSLGCALSPSLAWILAFRTVQGMAGACSMSVSMHLLESLFPGNQLARGLGYNTAAISTAVIAGPSLATLILGHASWPWLFAINLPLGLVALILGQACLPKRTEEISRNPPHEDPLNVKTPSRKSKASTGVTLFLTTLLLGSLLAFTGGLAHGFPRTVLVLSFSFLAMSGCYIAFHPSVRYLIVPEELAHRPKFGQSLLCLILCFMAQSGVVVAMPFFLQQGLGLSLSQTGFILTAWPALHIMASLSAGSLTKRIIPERLSFLGMLFCTAGLSSLTMLPADAGLWDVAWRFALCGLGFGLFQAPNDTVGLRSAPHKVRSSASALLAAGRTLGQTMGTLAVALAYQFAAPADILPLQMAAGFGAVGCLILAIRLKRS